MSIVRLSPQLLIATTRALTGLGTTHQDFAELPLAERVVDVAWRDERPYSPDARLVLDCGYWSHYDHRSRSSTWPLPLHLTTPELGGFGLEQDILYETPEPGDIFLQRGRRRRVFIHSGVVVDVLAGHRLGGEITSFEVGTVEGDTDKQGPLARGKAMRVRRLLSPTMGDRFLRWADLDYAVNQVIRVARFA